jgi:CHAT domain-containing protein
VFPFILLALLGERPVASYPPDLPRLAAAFVETLQSDPAAALSDRGAFAGPAMRYRIGDIVEKFQCAFVDQYQASVVDDRGDAATVAVDVEGTGITALHRTLPLPRRWLLHVARQGGAWVIDDVMTEEQSIAVRLFETRGDADRAAIMADHPEYARGALARALAEHTLRVYRLATGATRAAQMSAADDAAAFALGVASRSEDLSAQLMTLRAASVFGDAQVTLAADALQLAEERGSCDDVALALLTLGNSRSYHRELDEGARLLRAAGAMADQVDNPRVPLKALHNFAVQQQTRGSIPASLLASTTLIKKAAQYGWSEGEAAAQIDLGAIYTTMQRDDLALVCRRRALALLREEGNDPWISDVLYDTAETEMRVGHFARGVALFEEALARTRGGQGSNSVNGGMVLFAHALADAGRIAAAGRKLDEAMRLAPDTRNKIDAAAVRLLQHRDREAIALATAGVRSDDGTDFFEERVWRGETIRGRALTHLGRRAEALAAFRRAIAIIETRRSKLPADELSRQRFFAARLEPYYRLIDLLVAGGRPRQALAIAERVKARTLLDTITFGRADLATTVSADDASHEAALTAEVARQRANGRAGAADPSRLREAHQALDRLRAELRWRYPAVAMSGEAIDPLRGLPSLPDDAVIVEWVVEPWCTNAFVITRGRVRVKRIAVSRAALARQAEELRNVVGSRRLDYAPRAAAFAALMLRPIEAWIPPSSRLCLIPDGALWQVPFQMLPDGSGQPLLVRHPIAYAPSIALIEAWRGGERRSGSPSVLAFGGGEAVAPAEVESIARLYGRRAEVYAGAAASDARFISRAPAHSVLHVAAHAVVFDDWPMESSLLLSSGDMTAERVLRLPLHCDLAVLAACNTAGGHARDGEGVVGLAWAFLAAGCRNAVVSQWSVDSAATMRLMVDFHRAYAAGASPAAALRGAELALRRDARAGHPFYWAPFVVIGSSW